MRVLAYDSIVLTRRWSQHDQSKFAIWDLASWLTVRKCSVGSTAAGVTSGEAGGAQIC
jgi:hypothetical protein